MLTYTNTRLLHIITPDHYQYPKNRCHTAVSSSSTPSTITAAPDDFNSSQKPRYEECPDVTQESPGKENDLSENRMYRKETDYMTLKADDVQRNRMEAKGRSESELKNPVSGFAKPGPQSPSVDTNSHCKTKPNSNAEDESGTQIIYTQSNPSQRLTL